MGTGKELEAAYERVKAERLVRLRKMLVAGKVDLEAVMAACGATEAELFSVLATNKEPE